MEFALNLRCIYNFLFQFGAVICKTNLGQLEQIGKTTKTVQGNMELHNFDLFRIYCFYQQQQKRHLKLFW